MVRISFETDNAAFGPSGYEWRAEIARILASLAGKIERGQAMQGPIYDLNGNRVGTYDLAAPIIKNV